MTSYSVIGNGLHVLNLLNIALYGSILYNFGSVGSGVFDDNWLQRGFCNPHEGIPYRTTHDYSGHAMALISIVGLAMQQWLSRKSTADLTKADNLAFWALVGGLGHAFGHYHIAFAFRENFFPPADVTFMDDLLQGTLIEAIYKALPGYPLFWMPLVGTYMHNTARGRVAIVALFCWLGSIMMQVRFGFSYTQAVLFAGLSIDQMMLPEPEKGFEYALWPLMTTVPNGILAWVESTACTSSPLMKQYGHLIYDIYMASSYVFFYLVCWCRANYSLRKSKSM